MEWIFLKNCISTWNNRGTFNNEYIFKNTEENMVQQTTAKGEMNKQKILQILSTIESIPGYRSSYYLDQKLWDMRDLCLELLNSDLTHL